MFNPLCVLELFLLLIENTLFRRAPCSPLSPPASPRSRNKSQAFPRVFRGLKWGDLGRQSESPVSVCNHHHGRAGKEPSSPTASPRYTIHHTFARSTHSLLMSPCSDPPLAPSEQHPHPFGPLLTAQTRSCCSPLPSSFPQIPQVDRGTHPHFFLRLLKPPRLGSPRQIAQPAAGRCSVHHGPPAPRQEPAKRGQSPTGHLPHTH